MNKKNVILVLLLIVGSVLVSGLTINQFINVDLDKVNRNVEVVGLIKSYDKFSGNTDFSFLVLFNSIELVDNEYLVVSKKCVFDIDKKEYFKCVFDKGRSVCKAEFKSKIEDYCKSVLKSDIERVKVLQDEAINIVSMQDLEEDFNNLNININ